MFIQIARFDSHKLNTDTNLQDHMSSLGSRAEDPVVTPIWSCYGV